MVKSKATTVLVVLIGMALVTMTAPATAVTENPDEDRTYREANREYMLDLVGDEWDPDKPVTIRTSDGERTVEADQALDLLLDRMDQVGLDLSRRATSTSAIELSSPLAPAAGAFYVMEMRLTSAEPFRTCDQGGGVAGHYNSIYAETGHHGAWTWATGTITTLPFEGDATSALTVDADPGEAAGIVGPRYAQALVAGTPVPPTQAYLDHTVTYAGQSDFFCLNFSGAVTINFPFVNGVFMDQPGS